MTAYYFIQAILIGADALFTKLIPDLGLGKWFDLELF